jgi:hypothetical protein
VDGTIAKVAETAIAASNTAKLLQYFFTPGSPLLEADYRS